MQVRESIEHHFKVLLQITQVVRIDPIRINENFVHCGSPAKSSGALERPLRSRPIQESAQSVKRISFVHVRRLRDELPQVYIASRLRATS
jgi:hypothetical protein